MTNSSSNIGVDVVNYRPFNKDFILGFFSIFVVKDGVPMIEIRDCTHFCKEGRHWFNFPQKQAGARSDGKPAFFSNIRILDKATEDFVQSKIVDELKRKNRGDMQKPKVSQESREWHEPQFSPPPSFFPSE